MEESKVEPTNPVENLLIVSTYRKDIINELYSQMKEKGIEVIVAATTVVDDYVATLGDEVVEQIEESVEVFIKNPENKKKALEWCDMVATQTGYNKYFNLNKLTQKPLCWAYDYAKDKLKLLMRFGLVKESPVNHNEWIIVVNENERIDVVEKNLAFYGNLIKKELEGCRDMSDGSKERIGFLAFKMLENIRPVEMMKPAKMKAVKEDGDKGYKLTINQTNAIDIAIEMRKDKEDELDLDAAARSGKFTGNNLDILFPKGENNDNK